MICCVTGHRPHGFPFARELNDVSYNFYLCRLYDEVRKLIIDGYTEFVTGMADGTDIDFAKAVLYYRDRCSDITLEAAIPYPIVCSKTQSEYAYKRDDILFDCDKKTVVSDHYFQGCMQKRNRYMVDKADIVLAVWNGKCGGGTWNTIKYARSKGKNIRYIMLNELLAEEI